MKPVPICPYCGYAARPEIASTKDILRMLGEGWKLWQRSDNHGWRLNPPHGPAHFVSGKAIKKLLAAERIRLATDGSVFWVPA